jgi:hypothetical protein
MRRRLDVAAATSLLLLAACGARDRPAQAAPLLTNWRNIATEADRTRVRTWRDAWLQALAKVTAPADRVKLAAEGALLQPDAALASPAPPPGDYRCRVIKLGAKEGAGMDYVAYPAFTCRISPDGDLLRLAKLDGSQRQTGLLFPDDGNRLIFLGTMALGDERRALEYGQDPERDVIGLLERVGPRRWRVAMPYPRWESTIDVMELVPAS